VDSFSVLGVENRPQSPDEALKIMPEERKIPACKECSKKKLRCVFESDDCCVRYEKEIPDLLTHSRMLKFGSPPTVTGVQDSTNSVKDRKQSRGNAKPDVIGNLTFGQNHRLTEFSTRTSRESGEYVLRDIDIVETKCRSPEHSAGQQQHAATAPLSDSQPVIVERLPINTLRRRQF